MSSLARFKVRNSITNFAYVLSKNSKNLHKNQKALFHCSLLLNVPGKEIKMPSLSPTMAEGKIVKWLKKEGDVINPGDAICDIETDKAIVAMEVDEEGVLAKIVVPENSGLVQVGTLIALFVDEGEDWKNVEYSARDSTSSSSSSSSTSVDGIEPVSSVNLSGPPTTPIKMPALSPTMTSGTIIKWLKKEGDVIAPGDVLCDIQTDKAVISMETDDEGILAKILLPDDSKDVSVGSVIAVIVAEGEDWKSVVVTSSAPSSQVSTSSPKPTSLGSTGGDRSKTYGPAVKALLSSYQLDPGLIKPSGKNNRILKEDVMKYIEDNKLERKPPKSIPGPGLQAKPMPLKTSETPKKAAIQRGSPKYVDIEVTSMRKTIAKRLLQSKMTIPHSYTSAKCNVNKLFEAKDILKEEGVKASVNDYIIKATATALQLYPKANALCENNEVKLHNNIDISVAVATEKGLITPIIKSSNFKSLTDISQEIRDLAGKAKTGKLQPQEYIGGTFTISNLGMFGIKHFKAIISPPQCGILAVGDTISSFDSNLNIQKHITMTLSYDRRALDESEAAQFMETLKYVIENPKVLTLGLKESSGKGL